MSPTNLVPKTLSPGCEFAKWNKSTVVCSQLVHSGFAIERHYSSVFMEVGVSAQQAVRSVASDEEAIEQDVYITQYPLLTEKYGGVWKDTAGIPKYAVSNTALVYTFKTHRILATAENNGGYDHVMAGGQVRQVAHLVANAFVAGKSAERCFVDHKDRIRKNNHASNLKWVTRTESVINRKLPNNTTGITGTFLTRSGAVLAKVTIDGVVRRLGLFDTPEDAALVVAESYVRHYGDSTPVEIQRLWEAEKDRFPAIKPRTRSGEYGLYITKDGNGFSVKIKGKHIGYRSTLAEAIVLRDEYLAAHPEVLIRKKWTRKRPRAELRSEVEDYDDE